MKDNNLSLIVMPYHLAVMQADFTKLQLDALIIAVLKLQHQITALLNHQQSSDEAISRLVADHGVNPNMLRFPLNWKGKGVRGRYIRSLVEDTRVDGLGLRVIDATGDGSDCRLYLSVKMARHLLDMSKGYFYVSPQLCREMRSRYTVRLYWLMQAHSHQKGFTMSVSQLQAILCARTPFRDYASFERTAIVAPLSKLYGHCSAGQIPSYLLFCRLYNRHGKHYWTAAGSPMRGTGRPDALKFTIFSPSNGAPASAAVAASNRAAESGKGKGAADRKQEAGDSQSSAACGQGLADKKQAAAPSNNQRQSLAGDIVYDLLHDDLQLPEKLAECEAARVTDSMRQAFINHAIMLKEIIDEKRSRKQALKNQVAYILTCLHHFFEKQEARGGAAAEGEGKTGGEGGKSAVRVPANAESAGASGEGRANAGKAGANGEGRANAGKAGANGEGGPSAGRAGASAERADEVQPSVALKRRGTEQQPTKREAKREALSSSPSGKAGEGPSSNASSPSGKAGEGPSSNASSPSGRAGEGLLLLQNRWHLFLASYTGKATAALSRAKLTGQLRDGFLVSFATKDDEQAYRSDFDAVQQAARKALDISCRFQPGLIVE
ncbi:MAG: RepB family plasmid replication initiator protein [Prevotella sp.]|nr:RepB family plasmid replication initiator protein [Prevotella sp.]